MQVRAKTAREENFPVGSLLIKKSLRPIVAAYYQFARRCDDIADAPTLTSAEKLEALHKIEDIFLGEDKNYQGKDYAFAQKLRQIFIRENLAYSLATDLLAAFRQDALGFDYKTWGQLVEYCRYSAAPVGRFMLALHDENPSTYQPAAAICVALQIINHLQDLRYDATVQNRIYLPEELLRKYGVKSQELKGKKSSPALKALIRDCGERIRGLLQDGAVLPQIIRNFGLRAEVCVILSLTNIMLKKIIKGDVLCKQIRLNAWDWIRACCRGTARAIFTRRKTLPYGRL